MSRLNIKHKCVNFTWPGWRERKHFCFVLPESVFYNISLNDDVFNVRVTESIMLHKGLLSSFESFLRMSTRNILTSRKCNNSRKNVPLIPKSSMKFNIGQLEKIQGKQQPSFLEWMVTEEGKKKMALYVGWGGTLVLFAGRQMLYTYRPI